MPAVVFEYDLSQHGIDKKVRLQVPDMINGQGTCLLYTSDAADE